MRKVASVSDWFRKMRFRRKLIVTYLIITLIPLVSLVFVAYGMSNSFLNEQLHVLLSASNQQTANFLSNRLDKNNEFIRFTAFSPHLMEDFNGEPKNWYSISQKINNYFEPVAWYNVNRNPDFNQLHIYFKYMDSSMGTFILPGKLVEDQGWYQHICQSADTHWYFDDGELYAARRIWNAPLNLLLGAVHMKMNFKSIMDSLTADQQRGYGIILADKEGNKLYSSEASGSLDEAALLSLMKNPGGTTAVNGSKYYVTMQTVPGYGWDLYSYAIIDAFINQRQQILYIVFLITGSCAVLLLGLIWLFTTALVKRLELLSNQMSRIPGLDRVAPVQLKDEIGVLTDRFGDLLGQVHKTELLLKEEELKALQAQISPHFLYNTLSLINWKALESDNMEIAQIAGFISTFYRTCLNKGNSLISIENEINNIQSYINLQRIMHNDEFDVAYRIDPQTLSYNTINFTLQPLVENAILHGLDENEGVRGNLLICVEIMEDRIRFVVEDNGVGIGGEKLKTILYSENGGYGIKNVIQRIKLYFGDSDKYGIFISSAPGKGTRAELYIPLQ